MPSIREFIAHLRDVATHGGGRVIVAILLVDGAVVAAVALMLGMNSLPALTGLWQISFNIGILLFCMLVALSFWLALQKPTTITTPIQPPLSQQPSVPEVMQTKTKDTQKHPWFGENGLIYLWGRRIVLVWLFIFAAGIYLWGGFMLWQTGIYPSIKQIAAKGIIWSSPESVMTLVMPILFGSIWLLLPLMTYVEAIRDRSEGREENKKSSRRRRL